MSENTISIKNTEALEDIFEDTLEEENNTPKTNGDIDNPNVTLNVYGREVTMPLNQAKTAAQKGLAFDHLKTQLAKAKNDVRIKALENISRLSGQSVQSLIEDMSQKAVLNQIVSRYGSVENAPFEAVSEAVRCLEENKNTLADFDRVSKEEEYRYQLREFLSNNPGCKDIPNEVLDRVRQGENLSLAYSNFNVSQMAGQIADLKAEIEMLKGEKKAYETSTPTALNEGAQSDYDSGDFYTMMKNMW